MDNALIGGIKWREGVDVDQIVLDVADALKKEGLRPVGVIQRNKKPEVVHCEGVSVEFIASDRSMSISQELGREAKGCRLDTMKLAEVAGALAEELEADADLLVLNRFGKAEADGRGLIDCASSAIAADIPVLMAICPKHVDEWRAYHGGFGVEIEPTTEDVYSWCRRAIGAPLST